MVHLTELYGRRLRPSNVMRVLCDCKNDRLLRPQSEPMTRLGVASQKALSNIQLVRDDLLASAM